MRKVLNSFLFLAAVLVALLVALVVFQEALIYYPQKYDHVLPAQARAMGVKFLNFRTSQGDQTAFLYLAGGADQENPPKRLWLTFSGNAGLALYWLSLLQHIEDPDVGFLLIDYPSYGFNEGRPSPETILESSERALETLSSLRGWTLGRDQLGVLGHSIGAAAALQFADVHPVGRVVLLSPFTSLADMAQRLIFIRLDAFLRHRFDNVVRLKSILAQDPVPIIAIFHGDLDSVIPVQMGRNLSTLDSRIRFVEIPGAGHNDIIHRSAPKSFLEALSP